MTQAQWSQDTYLKAWDFATLAHHGQVYQGEKQGEEYDYINHVGGVTMEVIWALQHETEMDANLAIQCALLHDVLEDTDCTYSDLNERFGKGVADGVSALSKNPEIRNKSEQMKDSLARITQQPKEIWMIKLADRINNLSPPPWNWDSAKIAAYHEQSELILSMLASSCECLSQRLAQKIELYKQYL